MARSPSIFRLGKVAYDAYCRSTGGKSVVTGQLLPPFGNTPEGVQVGWMMAALEVKKVVLEGMRKEAGNDSGS